MKFIFILLNITFYFSIKSYSQESAVTSNHFDSLFIQQHPLQPYKSERNYPAGCNFQLGCNDMSIIFYQIIIDKKQKILKLSGRIYTKIINGDTIGNPAAVIFVATPRGNKLKKKKNGRFIPVILSNNSISFPHRVGDFLIKVNFQKKNHLYFGDSMYQLIEYDIGKLL
jgi:hypothetical protein